MVKIWGKVVKNDKIIKQFVFKKDCTIDYADFLSYTTEICYQLEIPTPVVIKTHIFNYAKYNYVKFLPSDFVEEVDFDKLILENIEGK